jgi:hypothetical protein
MLALVYDLLSKSELIPLRARISYMIALVIIMILGLGSRRYGDLLPEFIADHSGDVLWASMIYFGVRALFVKKSFYWAFGVGLAFCFAIEFSQLYQEEWINAIRATSLGALVLGKGFLAADLLRYSVGVAVSCGIDKLLNRRKEPLPLDNARKSEYDHPYSQ